MVLMCHLLICCLFLLVSSPGAGSSYTCGKVSGKTSTLHSISPHLALLFPCCIRGGSQTNRYLEELFQLFHLPSVNLIYNPVLLDVGSCVGYWLFCSRSQSYHPQSWKKKKEKKKGGLEAPEEWHIQPLRLLLYTCSLCQQCTGEFNLHHF